MLRRRLQVPLTPVANGRASLLTYRQSFEWFRKGHTVVLDSLDEAIGELEDAMMRHWPLSLPVCLLWTVIAVPLHLTITLLRSRDY